MSLILKRCASSTLTFWLLPYGMLLLTAGTIAQKTMGLNGALEVFFHSWVIWAGPLPLAGGYMLSLLFFINLLSRFLAYSVWTWNKAGIHLAHAGVLLLMIGGFLSGAMRAETVMVIDENQMAQTAQSYDQNALTITRNGERIAQRDLVLMSDGDIIADDTIPFDIEVLKICRNCEIEMRENGDGWAGPAAKMKLANSAPENDPEMDLSGAEFTIRFDDGRTDENHLAFLYFPKPPQFSIGPDDYSISIERLSYPLPFSIKLEKFEAEFYPGSRRAESYQSDLSIFYEGTQNSARVSMNKPVSFRGYKIYQSAYQMGSDGQLSSVLALVKNPAQALPIGGGIICILGLLLHVILRRRDAAHKGTKRVAAFLILCALMGPANIAFADVKNTDLINNFPVLYNGRVMPVDSFARSQIDMISGSETFQDETPTQTLSRFIFDPYDAVRTPIFHVENAMLKSRFGLPNIQDMFAYQDLTRGLDETEDAFFRILARREGGQKLSADEQALADLHQRSLYFLQLVRSFSFAMPLQGSNANEILDFAALQKNTQFLKEALQSIRETKGDDVDSYTDAELQTLEMNYQLDTLERIGRENVLFRVIPTGDARTPYVSPWQVLTGGRGSPSAQNYMQAWVSMMIAYQADQDEMFERHALNLKSMYNAGQTARKVELVFHTYNIPLITIMFLILASAMQLSKPQMVRKHSRLPAAIAGMTVAAQIAYTVTILGRPPVGTLYESILFVVIVLILAGLGFKHLSTLVRGLLFMSTAALLATAQWVRGDSFQVLEAVLNTNFWLATHVLIVTLGYGWAILTAVIAHACLYKKRLAGHVERHAVIALALVATGTFLGGIWADQSWGRFWGWDPKENGALLIILWLLWALHSRISRHFNDVIYLACLAGTGMIVALSWFGVNLLNVGLHAYGFTSGLFFGLFTYLILNMGVIVWLAIRYRGHNAKT